MNDSGIEGQSSTCDARPVAPQQPAKGALRPSEEMFFKLFHSSPVAISLATLQTGRYLEANDEFLRLLERTREELIGHTAFELNIWVDPHQRAAIIDQLRERGSLRNLELEMRAKSGPIRHVLWAVETIEIGGEECLLALALDISERKRAEQALLRRSRQLELLSRASQQLNAVLEIQVVLRQLTAAALELTGAAAGAAGLMQDGKMVFKEYHQGDQWTPVDFRFTAGHGVSGWVMQHRTHYFTNDTEHDPQVVQDIRRTLGFYNLVNVPILNRRGELLGCFELHNKPGGFDDTDLLLLQGLAASAAIALENTVILADQKQSKAALRQSMELLQETTLQLLEAQQIARLGSYVLDLQADAWTSSAVLDELFGLAGLDYPRNLRGWLRIVHPQERAEVERYLMEEVLTGRTPFDRQYRIIRQNDGQERWVHGLGKLVLDDQGRVVRMVGVIQDLTERQQAAEIQARLATVVEQAAESIMITDTHGTIIYVNPAFEKISGYTAAETVGQSPRILKSGRQDAAFYRQLWEVLHRGETWTGRFSNRRKDGTLYEEEASISPVRDAAGRIVNYAAVKRDVTREEQLASQLLQAQKMEAIGQLAGGVAHDFNNILVALLMQIELLEMGEPLPGDVGSGLKQIRQVAERAADLTRQLLLFSRRQVMQPRDLNLNEIVIHFSKLLQRILREDVRLQLRIHPAPLLIHADAGMIEQVLMNLVVNARDAMPRGGHLFIETTETTVDEKVTWTNPDALPGAFVCVSVSDTGGGIPPEVLPHVFEPFFTTKEVGKGTGLGLATVFGIVKQHRGWIQVDNQPGHGVTFRIFLPVKPLTPEELAAAVTRPKPRGGRETILLAEDESVVRKLIRTILERHGYRVLTAANGGKALNLWQEHRGTVSLLLTDLVMPGVDGWELARRLQTDNPGLKVVFISGYSAEIAGRELQLRPGENFVQKPFGANQLLDTIRRCLDENGPPPPAAEWTPPAPVV